MFYWGTIEIAIQAKQYIKAQEGRTKISQENRYTNYKCFGIYRAFTYLYCFLNSRAVFSTCILLQECHELNAMYKQGTRLV